jgi:hypothetical protein
VSALAKRLAGFALLVIAGIILLKIVVGAIVGVVEMVLVIGVLLVVIMATLKLTRRG